MLVHLDFVQVKFKGQGHMSELEVIGWNNSNSAG